MEHQWEAIGYAIGYGLEKNLWNLKPLRRARIGAMAKSNNLWKQQGKKIAKSLVGHAVAIGKNIWLTTQPIIKRRDFSLPHPHTTFKPKWVSPWL
jgi:hypothetical protein